MRPAIPLLVTLALGCGGAYESIDEWQCGPEGTDLTYEGFGDPFMARHCNRCHSSAVSDRQGAPGELVFDTHEDVVRHRARIFARAAASNDSMPPGPDDPSEDEREQLAEWLVCRAP